jgi:glycosyltransferase involved in cell wall biosynthesis
MSMPIILSIFIPVYNESKHIIILLESIRRLPEISSYEIIIVNDGSTDNTHNAVTEWLNNNKIQNYYYIKSEFNQGKTEAIKIGAAQAKGTYCIIQDGDLEYDVNDIPRLVDYITKEKLDSVIGYRINKFQNISLLDTTLKMGVVLLTILFNSLYRTSFKDLSGGYKIFRTEAFKAIQFEGKGFTFCYEVVIKFLKHNFTIGQLDISYSARDKNAGKKIGMIDGYYCFCTIIKHFRF